VFAVGDVRHSAVRRVASAVGEGSVAVQLLHRFFELDDLHPRSPFEGCDALKRTRAASPDARARGRLVVPC